MHTPLVQPDLPLHLDRTEISLKVNHQHCIVPNVCVHVHACVHVSERTCFLMDVHVCGPVCACASI